MSGYPRTGANQVMTRFRWTVCALIFFATTVNYLDRQLFSNLIPFFEDDLKLGPTDLALINVSFVLPYGMAMIFVGRYIDKVGIKIGLATTFLLWTAASMGHALVRSLGGFMLFRLLLGVGESGMYPGAVKTTSDWFPIKERSIANGIFNAGANLGAILAPLLGVWLAIHYGWRTCFVALGGIGVVWIFFWRYYYAPAAEHPKVSKEELEYIHSDNEVVAERMSYSQLFGMRNVYGLAIAKALTDGPWWFILLWLPKILVDQFHASKIFMSLAIPIVYVIGDVGSVGGGWASSRLLHGGWSVGRARKTVMVASAACVVPVALVGFLVDHPAVAGIPSVYWAIAILSLAAAAHQSWSSNLFTVIADTTPKGSMAMAVGAINGFAMVGVSAMQFFVGRIVQLTSSYTIPFIIAGFLYLVAFVFLHLIVPEVKQYPTERKASIPLVIAGAVLILAGLGFMQYATNKAPYRTIDEYETLRAVQLKSNGQPLKGPEASVAWMKARWYIWSVPGKGPKYELVKFDTHNQAFVEEKGVKAAKYTGPSMQQLESMAFERWTEGGPPRGE